MTEKKLTKEQMNVIRKHTYSCIKSAEEKYNISLGTVKVVFSLRASTSGRASYRLNGITKRMEQGSGRISYNPYFVNNYESLKNFTVPHEVAHLITAARYGKPRNAHGWEWASVMTFFEVPANKYHFYDMSNIKTNKVKRHVYACESCERTFNLTTVKHNKIYNYKCKCGGSLQYLRTITINR